MKLNIFVKYEPTFEISFDIINPTINDLKNEVYKYKNTFQYYPCHFNVRKYQCSSDLFRFDSLEQHEIKDGDTIEIVHYSIISDVLPDGYTRGICNCIGCGNNYPIDIQKMLVQYCDIEPLEGFENIQINVHMNDELFIRLFTPSGSTVSALKIKIADLIGTIPEYICLKTTDGYEIYVGNKRYNWNIRRLITDYSHNFVTSPSSTKVLIVTASILSQDEVEELYFNKHKRMYTFKDFDFSFDNFYSV